MATGFGRGDKLFFEISSELSTSLPDVLLVTLEIFSITRDHRLIVRVANCTANIWFFLPFDRV